MPRPPLGLMPLWLWKELNPSPSLLKRFERFIQYSLARFRYINAGLDIPEKWY